MPEPRFNDLPLLLDAMEKKDAKLYHSVLGLAADKAIDAWKKVHPTDFAGVNDLTPAEDLGPHLIT